MLGTQDLQRGENSRKFLLDSSQVAEQNSLFFLELAHNEVLRLNLVLERDDLLCQHILLLMQQLLYLVCFDSLHNHHHRHSFTHNNTCEQQQLVSHRHHLTLYCPGEPQLTGLPSVFFLDTEQKGKEREGIYIAPFILCSLKALRHGSHSFTCKLHHACLSLVSVHQMAPPLVDIQ